MFLDRAGVVAKDRYENRVGLVENAPMRAGNDRNARGRNKGRVEAAIVKQRFGEIVQRRALGKFAVFRKAFQKLRMQGFVQLPGIEGHFHSAFFQQHSGGVEFFHILHGKIAHHHAAP
ncbi:hypothetical protein D3C87_1436450 [compost metagenome]